MYGVFLLFLAAVCLPATTALSLSSLHAVRQDSHRSAFQRRMAMGGSGQPALRRVSDLNRLPNVPEETLNRESGELESTAIVMFKKEIPKRLPITLIGPLAHPIGSCMQRWSQKLLKKPWPPALPTIPEDRGAASPELAANLRIQRLLGVDVGIDGMHFTDRMIYIFMKQFDNIDFQERIELNSAVDHAFNPRMKVKGRLVPRFASDEMRGAESPVGVWKAAQEASLSEAADESKNPIHVKAVVPGPMVLYDALDIHPSLYQPGRDGSEPAYKSKREFHSQLASQIALTVQALVAAGCRHIQIDEPAILTRPADALRFGMNLLDQVIMKSVTDRLDVTFTLHVSHGRPVTLPKPGDNVHPNHVLYMGLARRLDQSQVLFSKLYFFGRRIISKKM